MARARAFSSLFKDIHAPRDLLPELAAERHHNRELVLLTTNWAQLDLALNLVAQLEALGLRHHLLFGDNARLVEHVRPEQEQAYLEWSREFSDAHANFIAARDPESWSSVVMIRDRAFGRNEVRYIKVFRFPDDAIFEAWVASDERREMIRKGQALNFAVDESALERTRPRGNQRPREL